VDVMAFLQLAILVLLAIAAPGVVLTRQPASQAVAVSLMGVLLAILFFLYQAPDVALSQVVVVAVALPLMILLALAKVRRERDRRNARGNA